MIAAQTTVSLRRTPLTAGATCYVTAEDVEAIQDTSHRTLAGRGQPGAAAGQDLLALSILVAVIGAASFGLAPVELASVAGALLMVLTGVLTPRSAARALELEHAVHPRRIGRPRRRRRRVRPGRQAGQPDQILAAGNEWASSWCWPWSPPC